jgi:hypothetical protein
MYLASIALLLLILPAGCIIAEALWQGSSADLLLLVGKWLVFWAVGARLFLAGVRQVLRPQFTAEHIFAIKDGAALPIVREVGFGNLAMGALGLATLAVPAWMTPAAIVGGLYYGLAGAGHLLRGERNFAGQAAMISDFLVFAVLAVVVGIRAM